MPASSSKEGLCTLKHTTNVFTCAGVVSGALEVDAGVADVVEAGVVKGCSVGVLDPGSLVGKGGVVEACNPGWRKLSRQKKRYKGTCRCT
jgi:hypothetical protein